MSLGDDFIAVLSLSRTKSSEAEVVTDKAIGSEQSFNPSLPGMICPGSMKAAEHFDEFDKKHIVAFPTGFVPESLGEVGFTDPCRAVNKEMLFLLDEEARCQVLDKRALDFGIKGEVKAFQGLSHPGL